MQLALINNSIVENIIEADADFAAIIADQYEAVVLITEGLHCGIGFTYTADPVGFEAPELPEAETPVYTKISVGAFYDRFGALKYSILADASPVVQALIKDTSVRQYIDLELPSLREGLNLIKAAGHNIDVDKIISDPVTPNEAWRPAIGAL